MPKFGQTKIFQKNWAPPLLSLYAPLTSCKISKISNEPIQRKMVNTIEKHGQLNQETGSTQSRNKGQLNQESWLTQSRIMVNTIKKHG